MAGKPIRETRRYAGDADCYHWRVAHASDDEGARWATMRIHRIASAVMLDLGYCSKVNAEWDFLRDQARKAADAFLQVTSARCHRFDLDELLQRV